jgi:A118 family predicted phage portal protein
MRYAEMLSYISKELKSLSGEDIDICLDSSMARAIEGWEALYENNAPWLSAKKGIYSAGLPGAISAEVARLVTLELESKVEGNDYLDSVYQKVLKDLRIQTEYGCALGGLVFKPYPVDDDIVTQYIRANGFFPVSFDSSGKITNGAFIEQIRKGKKIYTRLEVHTLNNNTMLIQNLAYKSDNDKSLGSQIPLGEVEAWADLAESAEFQGVKKLPIGYFKVPLANTIDANSPLGVSVFSRAIGLIKEADRRYSSLCWELEAKEAAIHVAESMLDYDKTTDRVSYPAGKERLYRKLRYNLGPQDKALIDVYSPDIRTEPLYKAYQAQLRMIEFVCGLAYGTISDPQETDKTAEEVRASKQRLYATVTDIQNALETALIDLIDAIAFWASQNGKTVEKYTPMFTWDDSIIVDSNALAQRALLEKNAGIIDDVQYLIETRGMGEEEAIELVKKMRERSPQPQTLDFNMGGD